MQVSGTRTPSMNDSETTTLVSGEIQAPEIGFGLRVREGLKDMAPTLCLVGTLAAAGLVYFGGGDPAAHYVGFAQTTTQAVAPLENGRVSKILVAVGERVLAGQIVATLDTSTVDAEIAVAEARRAQLDADMRVERALIDQGLDRAVEGLVRERALGREEQARMDAEAKAIAGEVARVKQLVEQRQAVADDLARLELKQAGTDAVTAEKPRTLRVLSDQIAAAEVRRKIANDPSSALAAKLSAGLLVADRSIELLRRRREGHVLRAEQPGSVAAIDKRAGDVVEAGKPVVRLVMADDRVVACVPEHSALALREGDGAALHVRGRGGAPLAARVVALGPLVTELPARCWVAPRVPLWGREVTVALDPPVELIAGQAFDVAFSPSHGTASGAPASVAPAAAASSSGAAVPSESPQPMIVPAGLSQRTRFEPSGLLARPSEARYLVVSDDTGRDAGEGEPWIFAMSANGEIAAEPLRLNGVREVDDLEAITAGDQGEIYLLASQSHSRKGRRKPARTALLRVLSEASGLRVDGEVHIAEWLDGDAPSAAALGLPGGTGALDIEGLAFRDGALYAGLKAPLDADGNALVWKIALPGALFESGPSKAGLSLWGRARVDVELAGQTVPGGISDLLFLPDGTLVIASTPSTADGAAGALWRVDHPQEGALAPRLIQRFPASKPEGLAPSLGGGKLMIVFDAGSATPSFLEVPWAP